MVFDIYYRKMSLLCEHRNTLTATVSFVFVASQNERMSRLCVELYVGIVAAFSIRQMRIE